ncbi:recombinase family protein [Pectinatus frisingensis]|uniref:recombinase family protein n=1 Tax=Pectinatus frisingensis TaxID=865 RepID=UPI0018C6C896|nr:recombinase family protein [Pectinatus frisingensis]
MPKAKKAAIYRRVSTLHQADKDSLPMQRNDMINYAKYVLNINNYEVFTDAGYSGKNTDRPAFQDMMQRVKNGEFSHILVWKIDRISRNLLDFSSMYATCKSLGVIFISKNEQFDTSTAMGEAMLKIILVFAELERNMTSERVSATMISRANDGHWNGGRVPFGYFFDKISKTFAIKNDEAAVIHNIYDTYEREHSVVNTTQIINESGSRSRRGYKWTPTTTNIILRNPFYVGVLRYNRQSESQSTFKLKDKSEWIIIPDHHPAIIEKEQFELCATWLKKNQRIHGVAGHSQRKNIHIFAGLIHCGYCGSLMIATLGRKFTSGYRPSMYICSEKRISKKCKNKYVNDTTVGGFVFNYVSNLLHLQESFSPIYTENDIEQLLLKGDSFAHVSEINRLALSTLRNTLLENKCGHIEYEHPSIKNHSVSSLQETTSLQVDLDKQKRALERLEELYLFSDDSMPQKDYLQKCQRFRNSIDELSKKLNESKKDSIFVTSLSDEKFIEKATALLFNKSMQNGCIDFQKLVMDTGNRILKDFINSIVSDIIVKDGLILQIDFHNGTTHKFSYK